jgi:hypothetical protein
MNSAACFPGRMQAALVASLIWTAACAPSSSSHLADSSATSRASVFVPLLTDLPADVRAVCDSVAASWSVIPAVKISRTDSTVSPRPTDAAVPASVRACVVDAMADSTPDSLQTHRLYWTSTSWPELWMHHADGPDGESAIYQRGLVRCEVQYSWDGGDDADSTYVPSPFWEEFTRCWRHPNPVTVSDTGHPLDIEPPPAGAVTGTTIRPAPQKKPPETSRR